MSPEQNASLVTSGFFGQPPSHVILILKVLPPAKLQFTELFSSAKKRAYVYEQVPCVRTCCSADVNASRSSHSISSTETISMLRSTGSSKTIFSCSVMPSKGVRLAREAAVRNLQQKLT